jgi:hypothetical protein
MLLELSSFAKARLTLNSASRKRHSEELQRGPGAGLIGINPGIRHVP